ncbi:glycoside hydrolase family protein [Nostoc sp. UHCC 0252]|uniref:glycoside hydrolase family protein n=1 Tax=Nostoc sp. UHCC 0252 TaxID=3110241 RepID=UPI002B1F2D18|nr:glycoside hydrolase family protein [Nostoc sp. UHCC 0252]MEA5603715.1 glycoside hydrolase family protein [Nostoc sp. UHCC 0252]
MSQFNNQNPNLSQDLLEPYLKVTIGSKGSTEGETFTIGDGRLIKASVTLAEGKAQSNCSFTVYDPQKRLADKFFSYVESVDGLDPVEAASESNNNATPSATSITNSVIPEANSGSNITGKVLFEKTKATVFNDTMGSMSNRLYPDRDLGCAMRYNNPAAARQFGSEGMFTNLKFGDKVKVTNLDNGKSVICDIQDWGPNPRLADKGIDLFTRAFNELSNTQGYQAAFNIGVLNNIKVELVENATTTSTSSTSNQTKQQTTTQQSNQTKASQVANSSVPDYTVDSSLSVNMRATLDTIAFAEGAKYNMIFGGSTFSSYAKHPNKVIKLSGYASSASGRYQFLNTTWAGLQSSLGLPDFSPISQDKGAVELIRQKGAVSDVEQGNFESSITKVNTVWASLPGSPYGQPIKSMSSLKTYYLSRIKFYKEGGVNNSNVAPSVAASQSPATAATPTVKTLVGAQITIEMGYQGKAIAAYSFIHTGIKFSLFEPDALEFTGTAATFVLTQIVRNTVYTNLTLKKIAQKITANYGMKLEMPEDGPLYSRFPQRGITDYEALLIEARRIGYRVHCVGPTLYIGPRKGLKADQNVFVCEYGTNLGGTFTVSHQAQTSSSGGARSSKPGETTSVGERKFEINPDTGVMTQKKKENVVGTGGDNLPSTTGAISPTPAPTTTGTTDTADSQRASDESRIKGILAQAEFPTTPEVLTLDPDTLFLTKGISDKLDRLWVVDSITHTYSGGSFLSKATCYSPLKSKAPTTDIPASSTSITNPVVGTTSENITKAQATGSFYLLVVRTGKKDSFGLELLNLLLVDSQGNVKGSVNASSGSGGNQTFAGPGQTTAGSGDPCEEGLYNLGSEVPGVSAGVGAIFIPMNPTFSTTRSAIGLHLDANRRTSPGSAGCITPHTLAEFSTARKWIKDNNITTIRCYWGISPTFGNTISKETKPTSNASINSTLPTSKNQALYNAAIACRGFDTTAGPGKGNIACVWAVNRVLEKANIPNPWGNSDAVAVAQSNLESGKGIKINSNEAAPGDIAIWNRPGGQHIGIVLGDKIISNSSSKRRFLWESPASSYENFYKVKTSYYRLR